ncbi:hypothetical protein NFJ24_11880 [Citrobacter braakii]|uniref:hypothetical protein n=1 Tax=Citrobacter braakii TaxID=57706 RepID=UPI001F2E97D1|nr:hypothetical protein [Citrobacter braakii]MCF2473401.1 hypothetical protein [Citrobacter braakii]WFV25249.1 hypothetical protein NFJ24_11880 [Citrobacter braakii]
MSSSFQSGLAGGAFPGMKKTASWLEGDNSSDLIVFHHCVPTGTAKLRMAKEGSAFGVI